MRVRNWLMSLTAAALVWLVAIIAVAPVAEASLSQGYTAKSPIATGSLVALDPKSSGSVVVADQTNAERLFGVVVPPASASISLGGDANGQVQVVTTGTAAVLVSTAGGDIKVGDAIAVSPISGVGQKAGTRARVIGTAQADFNGQGDGVTRRSIELTGGGKKEVALGQIPVVIAVATTTKDDAMSSNSLPPWLQNLSNSVAGKTVSPVRVVIAGLILIVALVSVSVLLYSATRNSIISIGRNPLSRSSVLKGLLQVLLIVGVILALTAGGMYLVISR